VQELQELQQLRGQQVVFELALQLLVRPALELELQQQELELVRLHSA
jgi:hypothetical protein